VEEEEKAAQQKRVPTFKAGAVAPAPAPAQPAPRAPAQPAQRPPVAGGVRKA